MQIDYRFIKKILNELQNKQSHYFLVKDLMEDVQVSYPEIEKEDYIDLFYGHLHLLKDNEAIEEVAGQDLGIRYNSNGQITTSGCYIRLTSKGYDLAKVLNKNEILEKVKRLTLAEVMLITNSVITDSACKFINSITG